MSVASGKTVGACLGIVFGVMLLFVGLMLSLLDAPVNTFHQMITNIMVFGGVILLIVGVGLIPSARSESKRVTRILRIAAVRKEVTITEISQETGLDPEYVRSILERYLMNGLLFGYIEGDLFVRDTSGRPIFRPGTSGLFSGGQ